MSSAAIESRIASARKRKQEEADLRKGKRLREQEIEIYVELIAEREAKLQEPALHPLKKIHLEWDLIGLREDVQRWKKTLDLINEKLGTSKSSKAAT